jgi:signal transduction histidine kinase
VLVVVTTAVVFISGMGYNEGLTPLYAMLAAGNVAANSTSLQTGIAAVYIFASLVALYFFSEPNFRPANFAANIAFFSAVFMIGVTIKTRRQRMEALEQRATAVEREREEESRRAVADERLRIARELHDVVAHSMGVIAVQAGVGEHVIDTDPDAAKRSLQAISGVSRSTLAEIRRMLGVLREDEDGAASYSPAPGLEELDRLTGHLEEIRKVISSPEAAGRRLDFLMQELNREANTLSSKSQDLTTTRLALDMKVLIEQMREQVQNIE